MAIAFVQKAATSNGSTSVTSASAAFASNNTAGNLLIVSITGNSNLDTAAVNPVTDTAGNAYHVAGARVYNSIGGTYGKIYYAYNCAAGANTITVNFSGSTFAPDIRIFEFSGIQSSADPLDQATGSSAGGNPAPSGNVTTTAASELLFGMCSTDGAVQGAGTGYTLLEITSPNADGDEYQIVSATGTYAATFAQNGAGPAVLIATFKGATASTDPFPLIYPVPVRQANNAVYRM